MVMMKRQKVKSLNKKSQMHRKVDTRRQALRLTAQLWPERQAMYVSSMPIVLGMQFRPAPVQRWFGRNTEREEAGVCGGVHVWETQTTEKESSACECMLSICVPICLYTKQHTEMPVNCILIFQAAKSSLDVWALILKLDVLFLFIETVSVTQSNGSSY